MKKTCIALSLSLAIGTAASQAQNVKAQDAQAINDEHPVTNNYATGTPTPASRPQYQRRSSTTAKADQNAAQGQIPNTQQQVNQQQISDQQMNEALSQRAAEDSQRANDESRAAEEYYDGVRSSNHSDFDAAHAGLDRQLANLDSQPRRSSPNSDSVDTSAEIANLKEATLENLPPTQDIDTPADAMADLQTEIAAIPPTASQTEEISGSAPATSEPPAVEQPDTWQPGRYSSTERQTSSVPAANLEAGGTLDPSQLANPGQNTTLPNQLSSTASQPDDYVATNPKKADDRLASNGNTDGSSQVAPNAQMTTFAQQMESRIQQTQTSIRTLEEKKGQQSSAFWTAAGMEFVTGIGEDMSSTMAKSAKDAQQTYRFNALNAVKDGLHDASGSWAQDKMNAYYEREQTKVEIQKQQAEQDNLYNTLTSYYGQPATPKDMSKLPSQPTPVIK